MSLAAAAAAAALTLAPAAVPAGGTGDFYKTGGCAIYSNAKMTFTNYDKGAGQEYHIVGYTGNGWRINSLFLGTTKVAGASTQGSTYIEVFVYRANRSAYKVGANWVGWDVKGCSTAAV